MNDRRKVQRVAVAGGGGISRVHPALARIRRKQERWYRPRGASFRLLVDGVRSGTGTCREEMRCATARALCASGPAPRRPLWKLVLYASGPLHPLNGKRYPDGRTLRGALLDLLKEHLGESIAFGLANHDTIRKSPIGVSLSRANDRRAYVTLLAEQDEGTLQLLRELATLVEAHGLRLGNGGIGTHLVEAKARLVCWQPRGVYLDVAADSEANAKRMVPGARSAQPLPGRAGRFAELRPWKVGSSRTSRTPVQIGPNGAYGYGVLA